MAQTSHKHWLSAVLVGYISVAFGGILRNCGDVPGNGGVHFWALSVLGVKFGNSRDFRPLCHAVFRMVNKGSFSVTLPSFYLLLCHSNQFVKG